MTTVAMTSSQRKYQGDYHRAGEYENYINALLADLQNSVPGHSQHLSSTTTSVQQNYGGTPGYGSLRTKPTTQSPTYQQQRIITETRTAASPTFNGSGLTSQSYQYHNQGSLPRAQNTLPRSTTPQNNPGNLSELDSLLQDLSNARYNSNIERKGQISPSYNGKTSPSPYSNVADSVKRPSVDSLLDELSNAHTSSPVYAVPNGSPSPSQKTPTPGRHVTITVRETKTEKMSGPEGVPVSRAEEQLMQQKDTYSSGSPPNPYASSATKELDDLMASLSDFKGIKRNTKPCKRPPSKRNKKECCKIQ